MTIPAPSGLAPSRTNHVLVAAGVMQLVALLTPAVRVRLAGTIPFFRLPNAGVVLVALGVLTVAIAFRPRGWWRWIPGVLSGVIVTVAYFRIVTAPSGSFLDPLLRHAVHPSWGFVAMTVAILFSLGGAAVTRRAPPVTDSLEARSNLTYGIENE
ncbi:MAG TPA: hypothetical protein VK636_23195 [Gemmatimonadaceae bacterium]|nr:hypothetical protein [Gemmatimonadaceae bacterium]